MLLQCKDPGGAPSHRLEQFDAEVLSDSMLDDDFVEITERDIEQCFETTLVPLHVEQETDAENDIAVPELVTNSETTWQQLSEDDLVMKSEAIHCDVEDIKQVQRIVSESVETLFSRLESMDGVLECFGKEISEFGKELSEASELKTKLRDKEKECLELRAALEILQNKTEEKPLPSRDISTADQWQLIDRDSDGYSAESETTLPPLGRAGSDCDFDQETNSIAKPYARIRHVLLIILGLILIFSFASTHSWKNTAATETCLRNGAVSPSHHIIANDANDRGEKGIDSLIEGRPVISPPPSLPPMPPQEADKGRSQALLAKPTYSMRHGSASGSPSPSPTHPAAAPVAATPAAPPAPPASPAVPAAPPAPAARASGVDIADVWNLSTRAEQNLLESNRTDPGAPSEASFVESPLFHAEGESAGPPSSAGPDRLMRRKQRRSRRPLLRRTALAAAAAVTLGLPAGAAVFYLAGRAETGGTSSKEAGAERDAGAAAP